MKSWCCVCWIISLCGNYVLFKSNFPEKEECLDIPELWFLCVKRQKRKFGIISLSENAEKSLFFSLFNTMSLFLSVSQDQCIIGGPVPALHPPPPVPRLSGVGVSQTKRGGKVPGTALKLITCFNLKNPKIQIHSLSTHHYAGGGGGWKCLSPRNTSGVSGVNFVRAESNTIEVNGESFFRHVIKQQKKHNIPSYCSCFHQNC